MSLEARVAARLVAIQGPVLVGCSGGGDSVALLCLAARILGAGRVRALSVNHHLRPEAGDEIALVAALCARLGVEHEVADWHWDRRGNLQAAARAARRALLLARGATPLLGHTADDQAETVLLNLARGSGVDGLAGMGDGPVFFRPLLQETRADLRAWLVGQGVAWAEDGSNEDPRFGRVRARAMADRLADLGLSQERLRQTAALMAQERAALWVGAQLWAARHVSAAGADLLVDFGALRAAPFALWGRVLGAAVQWFSGAGYRPRRAALDRWMARLERGGQAPLGGVLAQWRGPTLRLSREPAAALAAPKRPAACADLWDARWRIQGPNRPPEGAEIRALGAGLEACVDWRATGLGRQTLLASPAIWQENRLIAAPLAAPHPDWQAEIAQPFQAFLDSH